MPSELENESCAIQVRAKLNELKIKLWEPPYVCGTEAATQPDDAQLSQLVDRIQPELQMPVDQCLAVLKQLQQNAIEKLKSREEFKRTGLGTLRVRAPTQSGANRMFDLKVKMEATGTELSELIGERIGVDYRKIKVVCSGKMLKMADTLSSQGVQNGATVMLLIMAQCPEETQQEHTIYDKVNKIRADAETLVNENENSDFLAIENREGHNVHLPKTEKKALLVALMLYEKGKAALRVENYEEALLLFLEADSDFRQTNREMLDRINNYALLNLDIVWCYLCLKNLSQLPDAEQRLRLCEEKLNPALRRAATVADGERCSEKVILTRLHLLKAVLYFHQNKRDDARTMFRVVDTELQTLKIDDACLSTLLDCGFSMTESRVALRDCANNVEAAVEHIQRQRSTLKKNEEQSLRESRLFKKIGHDGADVRRIDMVFVDQLVEMGYPDMLAAIALKRAGNDLNLALNELQTNEAELRQELAANVKWDVKVVQQLVDMGYPEQLAQHTAKSVANNFDMALDILIKARLNNSYDALLAAAMDHGAPNAAKKFKTADTAEAGPSSTGRGSTAEGTSKPATSKKSDNSKKKMMNLLFKSFSQDIKCSADSHLDLSLLEEAAILSEYKKLLNMD